MSLGASRVLPAVERRKRESDSGPAADLAARPTHAHC